MPLIVDQTIAVAREDNPVERAEYSSVLAEGIAKDILLTSLRGDKDRAGQLGGHFGRVLEQGVAVNLQRLDRAKATYQQNRRYQQVLARTQQSVILLHQSVEAAPPEARKALEAALVSGGMAKAAPVGPSRRSWRWLPGHIRVFVVPHPAPPK